MLDINLIRQNPDDMAGAIAKRGIRVNFTPLLGWDADKRRLQTEVESLRAERNKFTRETPREKAAEIKEKIASAEITLNDLEKKIFDFLSAVPNVPLPEVIAGDKDENRVIRTHGKMRAFDFKPRDHVELCTRLGLVDYERGAKMSGAGAWVYTGLGARLEWALLNYFIDYHVANGYTFVLPPHLLNYESGYSAGQFPKFIDDVFTTSIDGETDKDNAKFRFLLPTSETALINMHRGETIQGDKLPIKYAAYSPCYRREAGSYRTSERGMVRGYQFNKIEMFVYCVAQDSPKFFDELVKNAENLVNGLGLHFQTVALAAGDVSASMQKTYDIEVWIPSMNGYKEVSSASNAGDYQARRANIRTRSIDKTSAFVHTLNASGLATSRIIPAIVEQFQTAEGHVEIPKALQKYMGGLQIIK